MSFHAELRRAHLATVAAGLEHVGDDFRALHERASEAATARIALLASW